MNKLFDCANSYIRARDWKMLAAMKFCLLSLGLLAGLLLPEKYKKAVLAGAVGVFLASYIPLMADFGKFAFDYFKKAE